MGWFGSKRFGNVIGSVLFEGRCVIVPTRSTATPLPMFSIVAGRSLERPAPSSNFRFGATRNSRSFSMIVATLAVSFRYPHAARAAAAVATNDIAVAKATTLSTPTVQIPKTTSTTVVAKTVNAPTICFPVIGCTPPSASNPTACPTPSWNRGSPRRTPAGRWCP